MDLSLSDHRQGHVSELHEVAAGTHASVLRDVRDDIGIDHTDKQFHQVRMDTRAGLQEGSQAGDHRRLHIDVRQRFSRPGRMASNDVVLKIGEIPVVHSPLRHRAETRIDAVDNLF